MLNRARRAQIPYWLTIPDQRALVLPQTPRRLHASRPVVSTCVASFAAAEPDARLLPLYEPPPLHGAGGTLLATATGPHSLVGAEWIEAARSVGVSGPDESVAEIIFLAVVAVMNSPKWLAEQGAESDDFPQVPIPGESTDLLDAADLGKRIAALNDPMKDVQGVTTGAVPSSLAAIGVPDTARNPTLEFGRFGQAGGMRQGPDVMWAREKGWRNVPDDVWDFSACGHVVLPKWLSYRVGKTLTSRHRQTFMLLCRRIGALRELESDCDEVYETATKKGLAL